MLKCHYEIIKLEKEGTVGPKALEGMRLMINTYLGAHMLKRADNNNYTLYKIEKRTLKSFTRINNTWADQSFAWNTKSPILYLVGGYKMIADQRSKRRDSKVRTRPTYNQNIQALNLISGAFQETGFGMLTVPRARCNSCLAREDLLYVFWGYQQKQTNVVDGQANYVWEPVKSIEVLNVFKPEAQSRVMNVRYPLPYRIMRISHVKQEEFLILGKDAQKKNLFQMNKFNLADSSVTNYRWNRDKQVPIHWQDFYYTVATRQESISQG